MPSLVNQNRLDLRYAKDHLAKVVVWIGGLGVIAALMLIFFYLVSEVLPLFAGAEVKAQGRYPSTPALYSVVEEGGAQVARLHANGEVSFQDLKTGQIQSKVPLPLAGATVVGAAELSAEKGSFAAVLNTGAVLALLPEFKTAFDANNKASVTGSLAYPLGEAPLALLSQPVKPLVLRETDTALMAYGIAADGRLLLAGQQRETNFEGETTVTPVAEIAVQPPFTAQFLLVSPLMDALTLVSSSGQLAFYGFEDGQPKLISQQKTGCPVVQGQYLAGGLSVLLVCQSGQMQQWFPVRNAEGVADLKRIRDFEAPDGKITAVAPELRRRGFAVGTDKGEISLYYATSGRLIETWKASDKAIDQLAFAPRPQHLLAVSGGQTLDFEIHNEHPEISFSALWGKVWYESYDQPEWLWQSSSASSDFEPKFSLTPLAFGTLKGAFYAMIFAVPLAIMGAIFVANFMSPELRQVVKPTVELLAALPSVILGFLAGLWLAPFVETNLPGMFLLLVLLPVSVPIFGYAWLRMPAAVRHRVPSGWEGVLLVPVVLFMIWLSFAVAKPIEALFFAGNMQAWMDQTLGIDYDQRNSLVVGIAMGIAVVPTIFSIAEDAIFSVPKQLSLGSLALGATAWQTLVRVILPTASPGIFSAVMIGLGRAVGETMIVLMATGNTPVTDFSLFSGMRTLAANVAVEMPESEVGSTHFRLLFVAGLVLFIFTFFFNTLAEVVRARLRKKYSSI
jgi:phosphate transport system permease protein